MQLITGNFHGTAADLYLQLGGIPRFFQMWKLETNTPDTVVWADCMTADDESVEGFLRPYAGGNTDDHVFGAGVSPYYGGDLLTTSNQTSVTYGAGIYIERDDKDYRFFTNSAAGIIGDASTVDITTWTLDTAGTPSGHFNGDAVGTYINDGSLIRIQSSDRKHVYSARIVASAISSDGSAANEIVLSWAVPSGTVEFIGGRYGTIPTAIGKVTSPGMLINETTVNASGLMVGFMAWMDG